MRLNGWQRLGVIVSFIWLPIGFVGTAIWFVHAQTAPWEDTYHLCEMGVEQLQQQNPSASGALFQDDQKCLNDFLKNTSESKGEQWWAGLVGALVPLFFFWGLAWVCVRLYRWVRAGFVSHHA